MLVKHAAKDKCAVETWPAKPFYVSIFGYVRNKSAIAYYAGIISMSFHIQQAQKRPLGIFNNAFMILLSL